MRRILALTLAAAALGVVAPQASAVDPLKCVWAHNRIGFPYGGNEIDLEGTVLCYV